MHTRTTNNQLGALASSYMDVAVDAVGGRTSITNPLASKLLALHSQRAAMAPDASNMQATLQHCFKVAAGCCAWSQAALTSSC